MANDLDNATNRAPTVARDGGSLVAKRVAALAIAVLLGCGSTARALDLTAGPVDTLPGGGSCTESGTLASGSGLTLTCTVINPEFFADLYFGLANNQIVNGMAMDGTAPSKLEIFRYASSTLRSIVYTSTTTIDDVLGSSTEDVNTRLVLTLMSGMGTVVETGGTPANGGNGDIQKLFKITSSTFSVHVDVSSNSLAFPVFGASNTNVFNPTHTPPDLRSMTQVDTAFYYKECDPVNVAQRAMLTSTNHPAPIDCLALPADTGTVISNQSFALRWQSDGALVLNNPAGQPIWSSGTSGRGARVCFQGDGNVVVYDAAGQSVFAAGTADNAHGGNGGEQIVLGDDCNLTVIDKDGNVLFQSQTTCSSAPLATFTPTQTSTPTATPTPTSTRTFTATPTPSSTRTFTATSSATPSATPTSSATSTPSATPTSSSTSMPSATPTPSASATLTPPSTFTPSATPQPTLGNTATPTVSPSETVTPSSTPTPTATFDETLPSDPSRISPADTPRR